MDLVLASTVVTPSLTWGLFGKLTTSDDGLFDYTGLEGTIGYYTGGVVEVI